MTETIFTGKEIKKLPFNQRFTMNGFFFAEFPWFPENFFMCNCPGDTRYRDC